MNNRSKYGCEYKTADTSNVVQPVDMNAEESDYFDLGREVYFSTTHELPSVKCECVRLESYVECYGDVKLNCECNVAGKMKIPAKVMQDDSKENEIGMQGNEVEQNKELCEWEKFICEASDILNCHSPIPGNHHMELHDQNVNSGTLTLVTDVLEPSNENIDVSQKMEFFCPLTSTENHGGAVKLNELCDEHAVKTHAVLAEEAVRCVKTEIDDKRTSRRCCLVYEMCGSTDGSSISDSANISNEKCLVANEPGSRNFSAVLPGIGLHLNALVTTGRDKIIVKRENLTCRRPLISVPRSMPSFDSIKTDMDSLNPQALALEIVQRACEEQKDDTDLNENARENSAFGEGIVFPQSPPKKKRKKSDDVGETDSCKRCNCKRSKCLKLYCECFAAGLYCIDPCNCQDCFNKPAHQDTVLETRRLIESRNPLAFSPKLIMCTGTPNNGVEVNKTPTSARHKRGCNCKKSSCLKKYCECFQGGVGCSQSCRCEGCKNSFGPKGIETVFEEANILQKCASDVSSQDEVSITDLKTQATQESSINERLSRKRPFHFGTINPQSSSLPCQQSLQSCTSQKSDVANHTAMVKYCNLVLDVEALESSKSDYLLSNTSVKSTSPNCKRISSDQHDFETSPGWKSCRKLILRSIPSFSNVAYEKQSSEYQARLQ